MEYTMEATPTLFFLLFLCTPHIKTLASFDAALDGFYVVVAFAERLSFEVIGVLAMNFY